MRVMRLLGVDQAGRPAHGSRRPSRPRCRRTSSSGDYWSNFPDEFARSLHALPPRPGRRTSSTGTGRPAPDARGADPARQLGFECSACRTRSSAAAPHPAALEGERARAVARDHGRPASTAGSSRPARRPPPCGEPPPGDGVPLADHIASRAHTLRLAGPKEPAHDDSATLTQLFLVDEDGRLGWLLLAPRRGRRSRRRRARRSARSRSR